MGALPVLYSFRRCPYAMRARLALAVSGPAHELREVVLKNKPAALLAASPKGTVPVLVLPGGGVIAESLDIMHWALARNDPERWLVPPVGSREDTDALIAANDGAFKQQLDRYKYPNRYPQECGGAAPGFALRQRDQAAPWLAQLNARLGACRAWGVESENRPQRGQFLPDLQAHSPAMGQKDGEKWTAADNLQPTIPKPDRLLGQGWLLGPHASLADMALLPFVRQFAHTDPVWFAARPWPRLQAWLAAFEASELYLRVMDKPAPWQSPDPQ